MVIVVIVVFGLGCLLILLIFGFFLDKFGCKLFVLIGVVLYVVYFIGFVFVLNMYIVYVFVFVGGVVNLFLDIVVILLVLEIFIKNGVIVNMFIKFFIFIG